MTYCHFHIRRSQKKTKFGRVTMFGVGNSKMTLVFEIDEFLINYSQMMTYCHFHTRRSQSNTKIGRVAILGSENSNMAFIFEIDVFFINYS